MLYPRTKKEAMKIRYGKWAGFPKGNDYDEDCCAYTISPSRGIHHFYITSIFEQCSGRNGHGPGELYCKQHAKKVGGK